MRLSRRCLAQPIRDNLCSFLATSSWRGEALPSLASGRWRAEEGDLRSRWCVWTPEQLWDLGPFSNRQSCDGEMGTRAGLTRYAISITQCDHHGGLSGSQLLPKFMKS